MKWNGVLGIVQHILILMYNSVSLINYIPVILHMVALYKYISNYISRMYM